ncbi:MAG: type I DNA topoisomerase, partial [Gemmatimonadaceae bacterium]|nr:type I DNA topoisomerase [Acetobacteraceae bacterium]
AREYWTVEAKLTTPKGALFAARLTHLDGRRLDQFDLNDEASALKAKAAVEAAALHVDTVEKRRTRRNPPAPFTTSTLQQDASRKLGMGAQAIMRIAQQLYEGVDIEGETVGLITYMRTDGVQMAREAIGAIRDHVTGVFGAQYLPPTAREYSARAKNAQEAHEAIRPTEVTRTPEQVARFLDDRQRKLYELIWKRAVASQMASAELDQTTVDITDAAGRVRLRATGSVVVFDGFLKLYREEEDDRAADARAGIGTVAEDEDSRVLPLMAARDALATKGVTADQHFTQPPPRYSEASLVKKMEELGIGRPSTYASILTVLRDRNYVRMENKRFVPEDRGRLVTAFLTSFFERYVDSNFTASLEEQLDDISGGRAEWRAVMQAFWEHFSKAVEQTRDLKISDVIDALDQDLGEHFFPARADGTDPRICPACHAGRLGLKLGRHGSFIGCANYPVCQYTRRLAIEGAEEGETLKEGMRELGHHPDTGEAVTVRRGPYGLYVQQGEANPEDKKHKPRRTSLPKGVEGDGMTLEQALGLLSLPRLIGIHPDRQEPLEAGIGRFGPYVRMGSVYASLDKDDDVLIVGLNRAVDVMAKKLDSVRSLGPHPADSEAVMVRKGRFGPYAQHGLRVANLPRDVPMEDLTLDAAVALLAEKGKVLKAKPGQKAKKVAKPKAAKAESAPKPAVKRPATKKKPAPKKAVPKVKTARKAG